MTDDFTVEITAAPVLNDNWDAIHDLMDQVPGTILITDPEEPVLQFPVRGFTDLLALSEMRSLVVSMGVEYTALRVYRAEDPEDYGLSVFEDADVDISSF